MRAIIVGVIGLGIGIFFLEGLRPASIVVAQVKKDAPKGRKIAVLIGVNEYSNRPYENLKYAERDMERLKEVLEKAGFEIVMLLGSAKGPKEATQKNIHQVLINNAEKNQRFILRNVTENDTVLIALSGHGEQIPVKVGDKETEVPFFCPKNAETGNASTLISINSILEAIDQKKATSLVLVDACRKFAKPVEGKKSGASMDRAKVQSLRDGIGVMFACSDRQEAIESAKAGDGHGLFFFSVLEAMKSAQPNPKGQITWESLVPEIRSKVKDLTEKVGVAERDRQRPQYIGNFSRDPVLLLADGKTKTGIVDFEYVIDGKKIKGKCEVMELDLGGGVKMEVVKIKKGKFMSGSPKEEIDRKDDEQQQEVEIKEDFWIGRYEVTQAQYKAVMDSTPSSFKGDKLPVEQVSWNDATKFCEKLSELVKKKVTLPTEPQWEYCCRAGTKTPYHFGSALNGDLANCNGNVPYGTETLGRYLEKTTEVGSYPPNAWGLYDMHGNLKEWCLGWHRNDLKNRVLRGGSWSTNSRRCRAAERVQGMQTLRHNDNGFRVCIAAE